MPKNASGSELAEDPQNLYHQLPYTTTIPNQCKGMRQLEYVCRGEADQLRRYLSGTPFKLNSTYFTITATDFSNAYLFPYHDVMLTLSVEYNGDYGGYPIFEYENLNRSVLGGREKWGYPKVYANIAFTDHEGGEIEATVGNGTETIVSAYWEPDPDSAVPDLDVTTTPHYLIRALPKIDGEGLSYAELLVRDTSPDIEILNVQPGKGGVQLYGAGQHEYDRGESDLSFSIESARLIEANWKVTDDHGWAKSLARLV